MVMSGRFSREDEEAGGAWELDADPRSEDEWFDLPDWPLKDPFRETPDDLADRRTVPHPSELKRK